MKRFLIIFLLIVLANAHISVFANIKVPEDTEIILIPIETVTSHKTKNSIKLKIKEDVMINNVVIFQKDAKALIKIAYSEEASFLGNPGHMEITNGYVYDAHGKKHDIIINETIKGKEQIWAQVLFACGFTIILFPLFLFGFVKGTNAKLSPKNELTVMLKQEFIF